MTGAGLHRGKVAGRRVALYLLVGGGLALGYATMRGAGWQGSAQLHTLMEGLATVLAAVVGTIALVLFYSRKDNTFLFIGTGFLGTACLDGYHALVTSASFSPYLPSDLPALIPWSWVASRLFLSVFLCLGWLAWSREERLGEAGRVGEKTVYLLAAALTVAGFLFIALVPLPRASYPEYLFHRPWEFVPAVFFLAALAGCLRRGKWRNDAFEHWLVLALIVSFVGQAVFMSFSGRLFDLEFDAAHLLKKVSYVFVLTGLLVGMSTIFRRATADRALLERGIEARKQSEMAAGLGEQKLRTILDSVADGIITTDETGIIRSFNRGAEQLFGHRADDVIGQYVGILTPEGFGPDPDRPFAPCHESTGPGDAGARRDLPGLRRDGSVFLMDLTITRATIGGRRVITAVIRDVTRAMQEEVERARQSSLLKTMLTHMDQGLVAFDANMVITASNARAAKVLDMPASLFEVGRDFRAIVGMAVARGDYGPGDQAALAARHRRYLVGGEPRHFERQLPDGRIINVRHQPLPHGGAVATYLDITGELATQDRLGRVQKMEAIGQLAGNIAHEFNNLLTSISGFTRMAMMKIDDQARATGCLAEVIIAADRAAGVAAQMLDFSRDAVTDPKVMPAREAISGIAPMLRMSVDSRIELCIEAGSVGANIEIDPVRLSQSLLNLVINGCQAMPNGGKVSLGLHLVEASEPISMSHGGPLDPGRYVCFTITDTGCGIEPEIQGRVFEPFFTTKDMGEGSGLGLAYVYGTITRAGGAIDLQSTPAKGTRFSLFLPVTDREPVSSDAGPVEAGPGAGIQGTVLVAEDDPQLREYFRMGMEDAGLTVLTASDGAEAERLYREQAGNIDLLVTDIVMPHRTGIELVESLQTDFPDLRAIFVTGYAPEPSGRPGGLSQDATVLRKPFTREALIAALGKKLAA